MLHAVVGDVEAAVAADDHVPAVLRVDPQGVLVGVDAVAAVGRERLAAVRGAVQLDAEDVDVLVVAGIDADLAEVHRPRVEAVDARPGLAAVGRLVDAAVLEAVGALLVLDVLALAAVVGVRRAGPAWRRRGRPPPPLAAAGRSPSVTSTSFVSSSRMTLSLTLSPACVSRELVEQVVVGLDRPCRRSPGRCRRP